METRQSSTFLKQFKLLYILLLRITDYMQLILSQHIHYSLLPSSDLCITLNLFEIRSMVKHGLAAGILKSLILNDEARR